MFLPSGPVSCHPECLLSYYHPICHTSFGLLFLPSALVQRHSECLLSYFHPTCHTSFVSSFCSSTTPFRMSSILLPSYLPHVLCFFLLVQYHANPNVFYPTPTLPATRLVFLPSALVQRQPECLLSYFHPTCHTSCVSSFCSNTTPTRMSSIQLPSYLPHVLCFSLLVQYHANPNVFYPTPTLPATRLVFLPSALVQRQPECLLSYFHPTCHTSCVSSFCSNTTPTRMSSILLPSYLPHVLCFSLLL